MGRANITKLTSELQEWGFWPRDNFLSLLWYWFAIKSHCQLRYAFNYSVCTLILLQVLILTICKKIILTAYMIYWWVSFFSGDHLYRKEMVSENNGFLLPYGWCGCKSLWEIGGSPEFYCSWSTRRFGVLLMLRAVVLLIVTSQFKWKQVPSMS